MNDPREAEIALPPEEPVLAAAGVDGPPLAQARLLVLAAATMWSTSGFFVKAPYLSGWPGPALAFWRAGFACLVLWPLVRRPQWSWKLLPMAAIFAGMNYTYLTAMA